MEGLPPSVRRANLLAHEGRHREQSSGCLRLPAHRGNTGDPRQRLGQEAPVAGAPGELHAFAVGG
jgi:hypothetical protein